MQARTADMCALTVVQFGVIGKAMRLRTVYNTLPNLLLLLLGPLELQVELLLALDYCEEKKKTGQQEQKRFDRGCKEAQQEISLNV